MFFSVGLGPRNKFIDVSKSVLGFYSGEILNKLKSRGFLASGLSTYDFSTLYTTLPHNLIIEKITELIEQTFNREGSLYLACDDKNAFLLLNNLIDINCGLIRKCVMPSIIFWTIY